MKQLSGTKIFVNHNLFTDADRVASAKRAEQAFQRDLARNPALRQTIDAERAGNAAQGQPYLDWRAHIAIDAAKDRDELLDQITLSKRTVEGDAYEGAVLAILETIRGDKVGRLLMDTINSQFRVWIVPLLEPRAVKCKCVGLTSGRIEVNAGGGIRVSFTPLGVVLPQAYYSDEDILFHELVHAYRSSVLDNKQHWLAPVRDYGSEEEVLAVQVTNVYRSGRGLGTFYRGHEVNDLLPKQFIDRYIAHHRELFLSMEGFLKEDKLAKRIAKLAAPRFNPWRDFEQLRKIQKTEIDMT